MNVYGVKIWARDKENDSDKGKPIFTKSVMLANIKNAMSLFPEIPKLRKLTPNKEFSISYLDSEGKDIFVDVYGNTFDFPQWR